MLTEGKSKHKIDEWAGEATNTPFCFSVSTVGVVVLLLYRVVNVLQIVDPTPGKREECSRQ